MSLEKEITIIHNANIVTMDSPARAQSMAFTSQYPCSDGNQFEGTITAVGSDESVRNHCSGENIRVVDLQGATILPAFSDCHMHLVAWAKQLSEPDLDGVDSLEESLEILARAGECIPPNAWLCGGGWNWNRWREGREPTRHDLDRVVPNRPAMIASKDWHTIWCNTKALNAWNTSSENGLFREIEAFHFMKRVPPLTREQKEVSILRAQERLLDLGIDSVHTMESFENFCFLMQLSNIGKLRLRVACYILSDDIDRVAENPQFLTPPLASPVRIAGIKIFADGSLGSRTAAMLEPYEGTNHRGVFLLQTNGLDSLIKRAENLNLPCAVHAIGDAANRMALDALTASRRRGFLHLQHRIEHCQLLSPEDAGRFAEQNIIASVQPTHLISDMDMVDSAWGCRGRFAYPFGSLLRSGARLLFGSDAPVDLPSPEATLQAATQRMRRSDKKSFFFGEESIELHDALRALTIEPAKTLGEDGFRGSLAPGKRAHFVLKRGDLF